MNYKENNMIRINKITTKTGDKGTTLGPGMKRMTKYDKNIELIGQIDELNSAIGMVILSISKLSFKKRNIRKTMIELQHQLFDIGAMLFNKDATNCVKLVTWMEKQAQEYNRNSKQLDSFLLPQGNKMVVSLHLARTKARLVERTFWQIFDKKDKKMHVIGVYFNRLSDMLFAIIRKHSDKKWVQTSR